MYTSYCTILNKVLTYSVDTVTIGLWNGFWATNSLSFVVVPLCFVVLHLCFVVISLCLMYVPYCFLVVALRNMIGRLGNIDTSGRVSK